MSERTTPAGFAVIDPEDDAQVARLANLFVGLYEQRLPTVGIQMREALREYVKPKPRCTATVNIAGEHFRCVEPPDHRLAHHNPDAQAVWVGGVDE